MNVTSEKMGVKQGEQVPETISDICSVIVDCIS